MNNNVDMSKLLDILSKMDKKELEAGIAKANQILKNNNSNGPLNENSQNNK